jgi:hypothetical protein
MVFSSLNTFENITLFSGSNPPAPPTSLTFKSATDKTLTFTFTAPSGIVYRYIPYVNGSIATGSGVPTGYTITGLSSGATYSVHYLRQIHMDNQLNLPR